MKELICKKCNKKVYCSEDGYASRMKKYKNETDMKQNFVCKVCKGITKKEATEEE